MTRIYVILSIAGWIWLVIAFTYIVIRLRRKNPRGFDVIQNEKQS